MTKDEAVKVLEDIRADFPDDMPEQDAKFSRIWYEKRKAITLAIDTLKRIEVGAIAGLVCSKFGEQSMKGNPVPVDFDYNGLANNIVTYLTEGK
jgi:hypothetical protein